MSIEEILRSNTIHELRELITSLENDSTAKKSELQQMVSLNLNIPYDRL